MQLENAFDMKSKALEWGLAAQAKQSNTLASRKHDVTRNEQVGGICLPEGLFGEHPRYLSGTYISVRMEREPSTTCGRDKTSDGMENFEGFRVRFPQCLVKTPRLCRVPKVMPGANSMARLDGQDDVQNEKWGDDQRLVNNTSRCRNSKFFLGSLVPRRGFQSEIERRSRGVVW